VSAGGLSLGLPVILSLALFGDLGTGSAVCSVWSRDPVTGARGVSGYLLTGEEGAPEGLPLSTLLAARDPQLRAAYPAIERWMERAEEVARWPQRLEVVVERGRLWITAVLPARREPAAALRWAVEMATGWDLATHRPLPGRLSEVEALRVVSPSDLMSVQGWRSRRDPVTRARRLLVGWAKARCPLRLARGAEGDEDPGTAGGRAAAEICWRPTAVGGAEWVTRCVRWLEGHRGRRFVVIVPEDAPPPGEWLAPLAPALRTMIRSRGRPRPALAVSLGPLDAGGMARLEAVRKAAAEIEVSLQRRVRFEVGAFVDRPRAALAIEEVGDQIDFVIYDVAALDAALWGRPPPANGGGNSARFDAAGVGVLLETGLRRLAAIRAGLPAGLWVRHLPDAALVRFCLRMEIRTLAVPDPMLEAAALVGAQAAGTPREERPTAAAGKP